jgi:hypothetical protein
LPWEPRWIFYLTIDDGAKVWIDGNLQISQWWVLMFGHEFGHQGAKSLEEDKLGFPRPSLSKPRLHGQVYQQSRIYGRVV